MLENEEAKETTGRREERALALDVPMKHSGGGGGGRFGHKSNSMFFVRHTAKPRHLRWINGVGGVQVCSIKEDQFSLADYIATHADEAKKFPAFVACKAAAEEAPRIVWPTLKSRAAAAELSSSSFIAKKPSPFDDKTSGEQSSQQHLLNNARFDLDFERDSFNNKLLEIYRNQIVAKIRKEQFLPPIRFWTKHFLICDDTNKWRAELNQLGQRIGLMTDEELKQRTRTVLSRPASHRGEDKLVWPTARLLNSASEVARRSCRASASLGRRSAKTFLLRVDENEREIWLVQILSQILNTKSMQEIQSWLVSADEHEKEAMKNLIRKALEGLELSERICKDFYVLHENDKQTQVDFQAIASSYKELVDSFEDKQDPAKKRLESAKPATK